MTYLIGGLQDDLFRDTYPVGSSLVTTTLTGEGKAEIKGSTVGFRPFHVALFGYYKYGNFGDDLMAVLIGNELRSCSDGFTVYGLLPEIADEFGFNRTDSIDELLHGANALVFGGGGAFLQSDDREFHNDILRVCEICGDRGIPIIMISVGGDGRDATTLPSARLRMLRQAEHITFRNEEDEVLSAQMKGTFQVYPDLVWLAAKKLGNSRKETIRPLIAIDDTLTERTAIKWYLRLLILICRLSRKRFEFIYFSTSHSSVRSTTSGTLNYNSIKDFSDALSATSLVITPRLHAGMFAMSQGIPVMLLAPHGKAELLFKRLHLDRFIFKGKRQALRLMKVLLIDSRFDSEFKSCRWTSLIDGAGNHLQQLRKRLVSLSNAPLMQSRS